MSDLSPENRALIDDVFYPGFDPDCAISTEELNGLIDRVRREAARSSLSGIAEPAAPYGYCPVCGARGERRERRPNGNDTCFNGHTYPSSKAATKGGEGRELVEALAALEAKRPDGQWVIAKGRSRPDEPLFGMQLLDDGKVVYEGEDEDPVAMLRAAIASTEQG